MSSSLLNRVIKQVGKWGITEFLVIGIVVIAALLRLWNLPDTLMFQGDQGRDAIIVADIFRKADLVFIGPVTSVGNMYLGPFYYYFMVPFLLLTYPSPVGPAYAVAIISIVTTLLVFLLGKDVIGKTEGVLAAFFFGLSQIVVVYSRFSWNPNIAPLFGLLMLWATYKAWSKSSWYWLLVSISFSVLIQLHYVTLLALPAASVIWFVQAAQLFKFQPATAQQKKTFLLSTLLAIIIGLVSLTPLMLFDYKHNWLNIQAFSSLVSNTENIGGELSGLTKFIGIVKETHGRSMHILFDLYVGQDRVRNTVLVILTALGMFGVLKSTGTKRTKGILVLGLYLVLAIIGTAFYQHTLFDHYLGYLFPMVALLYGSLLGFMLRHRVGLLLVVSFIGLFLWYNITKYPLGDQGWMIHDMRRTAQIISEKIGTEEKYNIILLSESRDLYGQNYRYYLTTMPNPPVKPENFADADKLVIINENQPGVDVTQLPIYEIQTFPNKEISAVYTVEGGPEIIVLERAVNAE